MSIEEGKGPTLPFPRHLAIVYVSKLTIDLIVEQKSEIYERFIIFGRLSGPAMLVTVALSPHLLASSGYRVYGCKINTHCTLLRMSFRCLTQAGLTNYTWFILVHIWFCQLLVGLDDFGDNFDGLNDGTGCACII